MIEHYLKLAWLTITAHSLFFIELTLSIILLASLFFFKKKVPTQTTSILEQKKIDAIKKSPTIITSQDIKAIAGDDIIATQLDLARAYIEIGKKRLAKKILDHVTEHGNSSQKQAAEHLMMGL
jgi:FimV-like protein